jgi:hypothetical protein
MGQRDSRPVALRLSFGGTSDAMQAMTKTGHRAFCGDESSRPSGDFVGLRCPARNEEMNEIEVWITVVVDGRPMSGAPL